MAFIPNNSEIVRILSEAGIIPPQCTRLVLSCEVNKPVRIHLTRWATPEECVIIAETCAANKREIVIDENIAVPSADSTDLSSDTTGQWSGIK